MLKISGFYDNSCTNGDGWRSVLFFSGCPHRCPGCHNPETWDFDSGKNYTVEDLTHMILHNDTFIEGVTFSGGEPFQERFIGDLLSLSDNIKRENLSLWCYTGYIFEDLVDHPLFSVLLNEIDVLIDGPYIESEFNPELKFRGSSNQRIIDVKASLKCDEVILYYDHVLERA